MSSTWAFEEMAGVNLKDARRVKSVMAICAALSDQPEKSLSASLGPALRQAAHRIFKHEGTTVDGLLAGHMAATVERCRAQGLVLIAQDTTTFVYGQAKIVGLAPVNGSERSRGLLGHSALALTPSGTPLGLMHLEMWGADAEEPPPPLGRKRAPEERESYKWTEALRAVSKALPEETAGILIQDREADIFQFLSEPRPANLDLLVRASQDRYIHHEATAGPREPARETRTERGRLFAVAAGAPVVGSCTVKIPARPAQNGCPARRQRQAELELRVTEVRLPPTREWRSSREEVMLRLIQARETDPPDECEPVHWVLLTTLAVKDAADATQLVGYYARRWTIERLHYTLKSGLQAERLQIDNAYALSRCLALYYIVAWRLMYLTYRAREEPDLPAAELLETNEIEVLQAVTKRSVATIGEAVIAVAVLAGYAPYRKARPPGVKVMWHGLQRLEAMVLRWNAARSGISLAELMKQA